MTILGQLEKVFQNHAVGWALDRDQPAARVMVEILQNDTVIATASARHAHTMLVQKKVGDGCYGFAIPLPPNLDPDAGLLRARAAGTDLKGKLRLKPAPAAAPEQPAGNIDGVADGVIFGWIAATSPEQLPQIEVRIGGTGGRKVAAARIGAAREDIVALGLAAAAFGFQLDLKPYLKTRKAAGEQPVELIHRGLGKALAGSPLSFRQSPAWGSAESLDGIEIRGWATLAAPPADNPHAIVELWIDGAKALEATANLPRADFARSGLRQSHCGFKLGIPARYLDGQPHTASLRHPANGQLLANGEQRFALRLRHAVTYANGSVVSGWMFIEQAPALPISLEAREHGRCIAAAQTGQAQPAVAAELRAEFAANHAGFTLNLPAPLEPGQTRCIRLCLAGQNESLTGRDILIAPRAGLVRQLEHAARQDSALRWWARDWLAELRRSETPDGMLFKEVPAAAAPAADAAVDIIVPVYQGRAETLACLQSLLDTADGAAREIVVINDASPDPQLGAELRALAARQAVTLLENPLNLGFVGSVNRGMKLHPGRDVILLNADTLVPAGDWISRLRRAAAADACIATVTPLSNRATICSLPRPNVDNDLPEGMTVTALDRLCARTNPDARVDIPTAVGFCMYIKRQALGEIGLFDEALWAKGYGEENDFCIKAAAIGWKHVAACDVFVQHHGAVSFQGEKQARVQENLERLNVLYPDYADTIARFVRDDPLAVPRSRIVLQLMQQHARRHVLHVTHAWGGGVQQHVDRLCRQPAAKGAASLILRPAGDGRLEIIQPCSGLALCLPLDAIAALADRAAPETPAPLVRCLQELGVTAVHLHQWIGLPPAIWHLAAALGVPLDYTVHDFFSLCPRIHLLDYAGQFCEQAPLSRCEHCVKARPLEPGVQAALAALGGTVAAWRDFHQARLAAARHVVAPCRDAAARLQRAFALKAVSVRPHAEAAFSFKPVPLPRSGAPLRVAVIGAIGPNKGYDLLLAVAQCAVTEAPHLRFVIAGFTMDDTPFDALPNVDVTGKYAPAELPGLLANLDCQVALFLSPWPETWSYTLSEALRAGLAPVVPALGALGERVAAMKTGRSMPVPLSPSRVLEALAGLQVCAGDTAPGRKKPAARRPSSKASSMPSRQRRLFAAD